MGPVSHRLRLDGRADVCDGDPCGGAGICTREYNGERMQWPTGELAGYLSSRYLSGGIAMFSGWVRESGQ